MDPSLISSGDALSKLGVIGLLATYAIVVTLFARKIYTEATADRKESFSTYVALLKEQWTDDSRKKDLFDAIGNSIDGQAQATRDLRQEFANFRNEVLQRIRP